ALLAVNGFHIVESQEARAYSALSALTILSYLLLDRAIRLGRRRDWLLHGLVNALAFYCHFFAGLTFLAQGVFVLSRRSRAVTLGLLASALVTAALLAQLAPVFRRGFGENIIARLP